MVTDGAIGNYLRNSRFQLCWVGHWTASLLGV